MDTLEAPHWGTSNEYPQHIFSWRNKENIKTFGQRKLLYLELWICKHRPRSDCAKGDRSRLVTFVIRSFSVWRSFNVQHEMNTFRCRFCREIRKMFISIFHTSGLLLSIWLKYNTALSKTIVKLSHNRTSLTYTMLWVNSGDDRWYYSYFF